MKRLGFEKQENGVIFTTSLLAVLFATLLVKLGYLIKIYKNCYTLNKKNLI
jgi:hypothetical protein